MRRREGSLIANYWTRLICTAGKIVPWGQRQVVALLVAAMGLAVAPALVVAQFAPMNLELEDLHMDKGSIAATFLVMIACGVAHASVIPRSGIPNTTGGVVMSCFDSEKFLVVKRLEHSTDVLQLGPKGTNWRVQLPKMKAEYDQYYLSPDGVAAVIATSPNDGEAYLVTEKYGATPIAEGYVSSVDFQHGKALVATGTFHNGSKQDITRVRIYDLHSGKMTGDISFTDVTQESVYRSWTFKLTEDAKAFYYLQQAQAGIPGGLAIRNATTGKKRMQSLVLDDGSNLKGEIVDVAMRSESRGHLVANIGNLYAVSPQGLVPTQVPESIGRVDRIVQSERTPLQGVIGSTGWGVRNPESGRWALIEKGFGISLQAGADAWTALDQHMQSTGIRVYDMSAAAARKTRNLTGIVGDDQTLVCANAYGAMRYENGKFKWHQTTPAP